MNQPIDAATAVRTLNDIALGALVAEHALKLREQPGVHWRPCAPYWGTIPGVPFGLTILCTEGCVAYFWTDEQRLFFGHVAQWTGQVKPLFTASEDGEIREERKPREPREPKQIREPKVDLAKLAQQEMDRILGL